MLFIHPGLEIFHAIFPTFFGWDAGAGEDVVGILAGLVTAGTSVVVLVFPEKEGLSRRGLVTHELSVEAAFPVGFPFHRLMLGRPIDVTVDQSGRDTFFGPDIAYSIAKNLLIQIRLVDG